MSIASNRPQLTDNRLLAMLPDEVRERLAPLVETVAFEQKQVIFEPGEGAEFAYFPAGGLFSILSATADGMMIEVGTIGKEGVLGLPAFLGGESMPFQVVAQVPGSAHRVRVRSLLPEFRRTGPLQEVILCFCQALLTQTQQLVFCNRRHSIEQRLARWMLMVNDRVETDRFALTHEFIAAMLSVGRPRVSAVAARLQARGVLRYRRGVVTIADRIRLESLACECYQVIRDEYKRLLGWEPNVLH